MVKKGARAWEEAQRDKLLYTNRLVIHAVDDATNLAYQKAVREFLVDVKRNELDFGTFEARDQALADYISDMCYVRQLGFGRANMLFNGFMHVFQDHRGRLPTSARALKSWQRLGQQGEGAPVPMEAVALVICRLFRSGRLIEGSAVLTQLDGWLREQDWGQLRAEDVSEGPGGQLAFTLGRRERGEKVKTGANQGVVISWPVTAAVVRALMRGCSRRDLVFPVSQDKFRREWHKALEEEGLAGMGPPHAIRHAGAASFVAGGGCLEAARRKGRWQTTTALARYTKTHMLVSQLARMTDTQVRAGVGFWTAPAEALMAYIRESPAVETALARQLLEELQKATGHEVELPSFDGGRVLTTGRPSTAARARHRRKTSAAREP